MITCPNCGYAHTGRDYASELEQIPMPKREADVILRLRQANGALVSKFQMVDFVYGDMPDGGPDGAVESIQSHISKARKKILKAGWMITSERYRGYRLVRVGR